MLRAIFISFTGLTFMMMSACGNQNATADQADYDTTKKMVVDILQTEDGKKALTEIMADEKMKQQLIMQDDAVKKAVNQALVSEQGKEVWTKLFQDPEFVQSFTKSIGEEQKKLVKDLMNDPGFQKQLLELLNNPEVSKQMLEVMKSQQFRSHLEDTINETLQTPTFQAKMAETLLKAAEEQGKQKQGDKSKDKGGSGGGES